MKIACTATFTVTVQMRTIKESRHTLIGWPWLVVIYDRRKGFAMELMLYFIMFFFVCCCCFVIASRWLVNLLSIVYLCAFRAHITSSGWLWNQEQETGSAGMMRCWRLLYPENCILATCPSISFCTIAHGSCVLQFLRILLTSCLDMYMYRPLNFLE